MKNIYFVPIGSNNELLEIAFENLISSNMANVYKINVTEALCKFNEYSNNDYFILSKFEGKLFYHLKSLKMTIFGPQLILSCLNNDEALPKSPFPLLSNVLKDLTISFTKVDPETRELLTNKINMMGGCVSGDLTDLVDVLVCGAIGSQKYRVAGSRNLCLFKTDWIDHLWEESSKEEYIDPISTIYKTRFTLKTFEGLKLAVTGLSLEDRKNISDVVIENGGEFCHELQVGKCSHLVARETTGQKYCYAKKWKMLIVTPNWVYDSIKSGYSLEEIQYEVKEPENGMNRGLTSTPRGSLTSMNSFMSAITVDKIDDTLLTSFDNKSSNNSDIGKIFDNCTVSLWKLDKEDRENIRESLEKYGAIVCMSQQDEVGETVTHAIVTSESAAVTDETVTHVTKKWIDDCLNEKKLLPTDSYLVLPAMPIQPETANKPVNREHSKDTVDWNEIDDYFDVEAESTKLKETEQHTTEFEEVTMVSTPENFLSNIAVYILNSTEELREKLAESSMKLIENENNADLIITNDVVMQKSDLKFKPDKYVSQLYIEQCLKEEKICDVSANLLYRPFFKDENNKDLLKGCVLAFTGIPEISRNQIKLICQSAGATIQKQMCRVSKPSRNLCASTHLIVDKDVNGNNNQTHYKKIQSAHDWLIPAVSIDWLNKVFQTNQMIDTEPYQVKVDHLDLLGMSRNCLDETTTRSSRLSVKLVSKVPKFTIPETEKKVIAPVSELDLSLGAFANNGHNDFDRESKDKSTEVKLNIDNLKDILKTPENTNKHMNDCENIITTPLLEYTHQHLKKYVDEITQKPQGENNASWMEMSFTKSSNILSELEVFQSLVIYISMTTGQRRMELKSIVNQLGCDTLWIYDKDTVTHLIFDETNITSRDRLEMEQANKDGKYLVSLDWVLECNKMKSRVEETNYLIQIASSKQYRDRCTENIDLDTIVSKKRKISDSNETSKKLKLTLNDKEKEPESVSEKVLPQEQKNETNKEKANTADNINSFEVGDDWFNSVAANNSNKNTKNSIESNKENKKPSISQDKPAQTSDNVPEQSDHKISDKDYKNQSNELPTPSSQSLSQVVSKYQLIMTNIEKDQRAVYEKDLSNLGVQVFKADSFCHKSITHLICPYPTRNEKFMAAVASGKWVLHVSFIDYIIREQKWPSELDYELHNCKLSNQKFDLNPSERKLAKLANQWRELGGGAYSNWKNAVVWVTDSERADRLAKVIEAGGGSVIPWRWLIGDDSEIELEQDWERYSNIKEQINAGTIKIGQVFLNCRSNLSSISNLLPTDYKLSSHQLQQLTNILSDTTWYKLEFIHIALSLPNTQEIAKYDVSEKMKKILTSGAVDNSESEQSVKSPVKRRNTRKTKK